MCLLVSQLSRPIRVAKAEQTDRQTYRETDIRQVSYAYRRVHGFSSDALLRIYPGCNQTLSIRSLLSVNRIRVHIDIDSNDVTSAASKVHVFEVRNNKDKARPM